MPFSSGTFHNDFCNNLIFLMNYINLNVIFNVDGELLVYYFCISTIHVTLFFNHHHISKSHRSGIARKRSTKIPRSLTENEALARTIRVIKPPLTPFVSMTRWSE